MADNPIQQRENKTLAQLIDDSMAGAHAYSTALKKWIVDPKGNCIVEYVEFYGYFSLLVSLTSGFTEMTKDHKELIGRCDEWLIPKKFQGGKTDMERAHMEKGINLFNEYYHALTFTGIITMRK
jgi:hypothetical protein